MIPAEVYDGSIGVRRSQCGDLFRAHFGQDFGFEDFHADWRRHFWLVAESRLALKPGVAELLDLLDQMALPRAIATSSSAASVERHLNAHGLARRFDAVVARGDYRAGKPAPDPFLKAAERLRADPRLCLALEDSHIGVRSAAASGMMTVMVPDLMQPTDDLRALCVTVARDLHEVGGLILAAAAAK